MKKLALVFVAATAAALLLLAGCKSKPASPALNMVDGQWEITMKVDMPGMPPAAAKPMTITTCLSKSDLVPKGQPDVQSKCEVKNRSITGNTVTWETVCPNVTSKGTMTYAGTTFTGSTEATMNIQGQSKVIKTEMSGKHIGACPDKK